MSSGRYWPALDGLRGFAILLVIPHNLNAFDGALPGEWLPAVLSHVGWIGVQIFFVLSGFLITGQLLQARGARNYLASFYARRCLRILPLYYLSLIVGLLIVPKAFPLSSEALGTHAQQLWLWIFLNNWTQPFIGEVRGFSHYWSLAVEEQFYLVWPLVVMLVGSGRRLMTACALVALLALAARAAAMLAHLPPDATYMFTICRMDALAIGAAAAILARNNAEMFHERKMVEIVWWSAVTCLGVSVTITHVFDLHSPVTVLLGYPLLAAVTAAVILLCLEPRNSPLPDSLRAALSIRPLRSVGQYSYAMYIVHLPLQLTLGMKIQQTLKAAGLGGPYWYVGTFIVLTYLLGMASYLLIERQFLSLKSHFRPIRDGVHAPGTGH